jgi:hypothetical protein
VGVGCGRQRVLGSFAGPRRSLPPSLAPIPAQGSRHQPTILPIHLRLLPPPLATGSHHGGSDHTALLQRSLGVFECLYNICEGDSAPNLPATAAYVMDCAPSDDRLKAFEAWIAERRLGHLSFRVSVAAHAWNTPSVATNADALVRKVRGAYKG